MLKKAGMLNPRDSLTLLTKISNQLDESFQNSMLIVNENNVQVSSNDRKKVQKNSANRPPLEALEELEDKSFNIILGNYLYFGNRRAAWSNKNPKIEIKAPQNWVVLYKSLLKLKPSGKGYYIVEPRIWTSHRGQKFIKQLENHGFYVQAIFRLPPNLLENTSLQPYILMFIVKKAKKLFVADLEENYDLAKITKNYEQKKSKNLFEGLYIQRQDFKGFDRYKVHREFETLSEHYKEFEKHKIEDLVKEIKSSNFEKDKNSIYLRMAGNFKAVSYSEITKNRYLQIKLDAKKVNPKYFKFFLNTEIGSKFLKSLSTGSTVKYLPQKEFLESEIYILPYKLQEKTIKVIEKLGFLTNKLAKFENKVVNDPTNTQRVLGEIEKLNASISQMSEEERLLSLIRGGESAKVEFKQTLSLNVKTKQKDKTMERMVLKTICGFLNTKGGTLFVGVKDNGKIFGIDNDTYPNHDKYLLHFKNLIRDQIGLELLPLIDYKIVKLVSKNIMLVQCKSSKKPVFLGKEETFYVRTNPSTDQLKGQRLIEYIETHFKNHD